MKGDWQVKTAKDIVMRCLKEENMTQRDLARRMQIDARNLNQKLTRTSDMKFGDLCEMLDSAGYCIQVVRLRDNMVIE